MVFMDGLQETISSFDTATTYKKLATTTMHELNARPAPPECLKSWKSNQKKNTRRLHLLKPCSIDLSLTRNKVGYRLKHSWQQFTKVPTGFHVALDQQGRHDLDAIQENLTLF